MPDAGSSDLRAAAVALRTRLPEPLGPLAAIAYNYRWSWTPGGPELFADIDPRRWELTLGNPVRQLQEAHPDRLEELSGQLAHHYVEAAQDDAMAKAIAYAVRAGKRHMALPAYTDAARFYRLALEALALLPDGLQVVFLALQRGLLGVTV